MRTIGLVIGIFAFLGMFIAFVPCLGSINWINIPIGVLGLVFSVIAYNRAKEAKAESKTVEVAALVLNAAAILLGAIRLSLGGGIF